MTTLQSEITSFYASFSKQAKEWVDNNQKEKVLAYCLKEREYTKEEIEIINKIGDKYGIKFDLNGKKTFDAVGCKKCNNTGYLGRIGIFEILILNDELRTLIVDNKSAIEIRNSALESGYVPLIVDGIYKMLDGITNM